MIQRAVSSDLRDGSVSRWHSWHDKEGMPYAPAWGLPTIHTPRNDVFQAETIDDLISIVSQNKLFVVSPDILNPSILPYGDKLLGDKRVYPYLSRSGYIPAIRIRTKRKTGFLLSASAWLAKEPTREVLEDMCELSRIFKFWAPTIASLSEKVLRDTLPELLAISRPTSMLRRDILLHSPGPRVDVFEHIGKFFRRVKRYDKNKAYLSKSLLVPSPFLVPVIRTLPSLSDAFSYPAGYWHILIVATDNVIPPIQVSGRAPVPGEVIETWLWTCQLQDCLEAGYQLLSIREGYGFRALSNFMEGWATRLWQGYEEVRGNEYLEAVIKRMMQGVPGRFLRRPETYNLVPFSEARKGDIPLRLSTFEKGQPVFSNWVVRAEYDKESAALTPVGAFIVAEMAHELYQEMKREEASGHHVISSYVDCYVIEPCENGCQFCQEDRNLGMLPGQWKERDYQDVYIEENRMVAITPENGMVDMKAPGFSGQERTALKERWQQAYERSSNV